MDLDLLDLFEILGEVLDGLDFSGGSATDLGSPPPEQIARRSWWKRDDRADDDQ